MRDSYRSGLTKPTNKTVRNDNGGINAATNIIEAIGLALVSTELRTLQTESHPRIGTRVTNTDQTSLSDPFLHWKYHVSSFVP